MSLQDIDDYGTPQRPIFSLWGKIFPFAVDVANDYDNTVVSVDDDDDE